MLLDTGGIFLIRFWKKKINIYTLALGIRLVLRLMFTEGDPGGSCDCHWFREAWRESCAMRNKGKVSQ